MGSMRIDHPYLYKRVRLKAILFMIFGFSIMFLDPVSTQSSRSTVIPQYVGLSLLGGIFFVIGLGIAAGIFRSRHTYRMARMFLLLATGYAITWFLAFLVSYLAGKLHSTFFLALWGYLTYNLFFITSDPAWRGLDVLDTVREHNRGLNNKQ